MGNNTNRTARAPQTTQDVTVSNNQATTTGLLTVPLNNLIASGVFFVDPNGTIVQCALFGGDLSGIPSAAVVSGISGTPISGNKKDNQMLVYNSASKSIEWNYLTTDRQGLMVIDRSGELVTSR